MKKIVIGGQLEKTKIYEKLKALVPSDTVIDIKTDFEAAQAMLNKQYDFYLGACDTGGGGALAMAIALLGISKCKTISSQTFKASKEEIQKNIAEGIIAFGMIPRDIDYCLDTLVPLLIKE